MGRPLNHFKASSKTRIGYLLRKRRNEGYNPQPIVIEASSDADAIEMEMLLIAMIGREDLGTGSLFNLTGGGEGMSNPSVATRLLLSKASKATRANPESQKKWRANASKAFATEAYKKRQSEAALEIWARPEVKEARKLAIKSSLARPEVKERCKKLIIERWKSLEYRQRMSVALGKQCTVDGITIYKSAKDLRAALGHGKAGYRSPTFRII